MKPLNYLPYVKADAKAEITEELGWRDYGGKHYESVFTRFFQGYYLPARFGFDKRLAHLSSLILAGQLDQDEAMHVLETEPTYDPDLQASDRKFVAKKLGISEAELVDADRSSARPDPSITRRTRRPTGSGSRRGTWSGVDERSHRGRQLPRRQHRLHRQHADAIGAEATVVSTPAELDAVDRVILPGVGHFDHGVAQLKEQGLYDRLQRPRRARPSRCWASAWACSCSWTGARRARRRARPDPGAMPEVRPGRQPAQGPAHGLERRHAVGSYGRAGWPARRTVGTTSCTASTPRPTAPSTSPARRRTIGRFCSAVDSGTGVIGYQFHPEKSHRFGMALLRAFVGAA